MEPSPSFVSPSVPWGLFAKPPVTVTTIPSPVFSPFLNLNAYQNSALLFLYYSQLAAQQQQQQGAALTKSLGIGAATTPSISPATTIPSSAAASPVEPITVITSGPCMLSPPRRGRARERPEGSEEKKRFNCTLCSRSYETLYNYREHMAKHAGKRFACPICFKVLSGQSALSRHAKVHKKPYACLECDKSFSSTYDLTCHHDYYHTMTRRFRCRHCDRSLYNYSGKLRHEGLCAKRNVVTISPIETPASSVASLPFSPIPLTIASILQPLPTSAAEAP